MTHAELHRAVAGATGETVTEIKRRGFQPLVFAADDGDLEALIIDWDELELQRNVAFVEQRSPQAVT